MAEDNREMVLMSQDVLVGVELPVLRVFIADRDDGLDSLRDELLDRDDLDRMLLGEDFDVFHAGHGSVGFHQLGDHAGWIESGERGQVDGGFRLPGLRSEEHTSELQSPDTISYAVFCL